MTSIPLKMDLRRLGRQFAVSYFLAAMLLSCLFLYLIHAHQTRLAKSYARASRHSVLIRDLRQALSSLAPAAQEGFLTVGIRSAEGELIVGIPNNASIAAHSGPFTITVVESIRSDNQKGTQGHIADLEFSYSLRQPLIFAAGGASLLFVLFSALFARAKRDLEERHNLVVKERELESAKHLARQVAHDIRSPLSALNMAISTIADLPESKHLLIKNASRRINEIALGLLQKGGLEESHEIVESVGSNSEPTARSRPTLLVPVISALVKEKQTQYSDRANVEIHLDIADDKELAASIDRVELERVVSNLVNNSVDAMENGGKITVCLRSYSNECAIAVVDNGSGIPPEVLSRLGERGLSHGKKSAANGSGLGLHHAKATVEAAGGRLIIQSKFAEGTIVTILLPHSKALLQL